MLHLNDIKNNLNISVHSHLLFQLTGSLLWDNNNAKQETILLYN